MQLGLLLLIQTTDLLRFAFSLRTISHKAGLTDGYWSNTIKLAV